MVSYGPFILTAVMLSTAGGSIAAQAQSYTAPAGIPAQTAPGGLTGVARTPFERTIPATRAGWAMAFPEDVTHARKAPHHHDGTIEKRAR